MVRDFTEAAVEAVHTALREHPKHRGLPVVD